MLKYALAFLAVLGLTASTAFAGTPQHRRPNDQPGVNKPAVEGKKDRDHHRRPHQRPHRPGVKRMEHRGHHHAHNYHLRHGHKFEFGYFYKGRHHHHWSHSRWHHRLHCQVYFDGGLRCWYFYCPRTNCYYPLSCWRHHHHRLHNHWWHNHRR